MFRFFCLITIVAGFPSCKVPIVDISAAFSLSDATWFEQEETLFIFYRLQAEQGLGQASVLEISYITDEFQIPWTPISDMETIHTHLPVDCGPRELCGSTSLHVPEEPRNVSIRLRYHREGELSLNSQTLLNIVGNGPAHSHRSFLVYGVFDSSNQHIQWRGRHQFPTLRNQQVESLGLRRDFAIENQRYGTNNLTAPANPYGYGIACPNDFYETTIPDIATNERALFNPIALPADASSHALVCALSSVKDATGVYKAPALARKNPEVRPAFPLLRSPIQAATPIRFLLAPCTQAISETHLEMQKQRLLFTSEALYCTDSWGSVDFIPNLVATMRNAIELERSQQKDMVLVIALHRNDNDLALAVENALQQVIPSERDRSTPRVVGAFVLDSQARVITTPELRPLTLWCPSTILEDGFKPPEEAQSPATTEGDDSTETSGNQASNSSDEPHSEPSTDNHNDDDKEESPDVIFDASMQTCAIAPDNFNLELGPLSFGQLPILPSRELYLDFIETYSEAQAGTVESLTFYAPEFTPLTDNVELPGIGVATFMNNEILSAQPKNAFSYCSEANSAFFVFRSEGSPQTGFEVIPIEALPDWHNVAGETTYNLGVVWDFPFLLRMNYETIAAGSITAFTFSVPFGISSSAQNYYGSQMWTQSEFSLAEILTQCTRFCDHPTFNSARVYEVNKSFRESYARACYNPEYPTLSDSGFPYDP